MVEVTDVDSGMRNQVLIEGINANFRALHAGAGVTPIRTVTASGAIAVTDEVVLVDATAGAVVLTLPVVANYTVRRRVVVKHIAGVNNVTLNPQAGEQVDSGGAGVGLSLNSIGNLAELVTDNDQWYRVD